MCAFVGALGCALAQQPSRFLLSELLCVRCCCCRRFFLSRLAVCSVEQSRFVGAWGRYKRRFCK
jgi:hypothetical protein